MSPLSLMPFVAGVATVCAAILFAEVDGVSAPTTITGAFIAISMGGLTTVCYIVKRQFDTLDVRAKETDRLLTCLETLIRKMPQSRVGVNDGE